MNSGASWFIRVTGQQDIVPAWPAAKILWLRSHEPEVFNAADKFLMLEDYLIYRLTGNFVTDHALNPSTLYYDLRNGCWVGKHVGSTRGFPPPASGSAELRSVCR
jgi:sugar (pentulose or hexulose) kinase